MTSMKLTPQIGMPFKTHPSNTVPNTSDDEWISANESELIENISSNFYRKRQLNIWLQSELSELTGSHWSVSMFMRSVRLAFVTSVICLPPFGPPVKFYNKNSSVIKGKRKKNLVRSTNPHKPWIHSSNQTRLFFECPLDVRNVFFQPHDFQCRKVRRDGQTRNGLAVISITAGDLVQYLFHRFFGTCVIPNWVRKQFSENLDENEWIVDIYRWHCATVCHCVCPKWQPSHVDS